MKTIVLVSTFIVLSNADVGFGWLEGRWISHADSTVTANPQVSQFDEDTMEKFRSLFGHTVWDISNGMFTAIQRDVAVGPAAYSIRPIENDRFELIIDDPDLHTMFIIWRNGPGFCAKLQPHWVSEFATWTKPSIVECYVPADA